jgi:hypothetical protein
MELSFDTPGIVGNCFISPRRALVNELNFRLIERKIQIVLDKSTRRIKYEA